jgi:[acyl-carrier-protein] S-malonyltransferase
MRIAIVIPGQGSQYVGQISKLSHISYYQEAEKILGIPLIDYCQNGPAEQLTQTQNTQPAIITHAWSLYQEWVAPYQKNFTSTIALGHSVGEYGALLIAGCFDFETALKMVYYRGLCMQEASPLGVSGMSAILNMNASDLEALCLPLCHENEFVGPANFNSHDQIVVAGHLGTLEKLNVKIKENFSRARVIPLKVAAAFHSPLMIPAQNKMKSFIHDQEIKENNIPYIANINAEVFYKNTPAETIKKNLIDQITGSVKWVQSIENLPQEIDLILEVGPGKTLKGLIAKIKPDIKVLSLDQEADLAEWKGIINNGL